MKKFGTLLCILYLFACAGISRPQTRVTVAFGEFVSECGNLDIILLDDNARPLPGFSVIIRSAIDHSVVWQGTTGMDGHIRQEVRVADLIVTAKMHGFYSHQERITIPVGKKCLLLIYTKPDPKAAFEVT